MPKFRIVGQPPIIRRLDGSFVRVAFDNEIVSEDRYVTVAAGGGFDDDKERLHEFRAVGTKVRVVSQGCPHTYAVTMMEVPEKVPE
jgi:hypothetical protein